MINIDELLNSPAFWIGIFFFFMVLGKVVEIKMTEEHPPKKKGK